METVLKLPENETPNTLSEVIAALKKQKLNPRLESKNWGDWIYLEDVETVIAIESVHGLTSAATIEHGESERDAKCISKINAAFSRLGWIGSDEDGEYSL